MPPLLAELFRLFHGRKMRALAGIPGPTPLFPLGTLHEFWGKVPWDVCAAYEKTYGSLTLIWAGGQPMLVLNDPELIREVLVTRRNEFYKDNPVKAFRPVLKETEFDENGPEWQRLRQLEPLSMKGFDAWLPTQVAVVRNTVEGHLQRLYTAAPEPVDLLPVAERLCYDVFNACAVGRRLGDEEYRTFYTTSNMATERMQLPNWLLLPPLRPSFYAARRRHFGAFEAIVREARRNPDSAANDMLHIYLRQGPDVTDEQLATFLGNIHAGGVFSTGSALVNTLYLLNLHPEVVNELTAQLRALVRDRPDYDAAALEGCPCSTACCWSRCGTTPRCRCSSATSERNGPPGSGTATCPQTPLWQWSFGGCIGRPGTGKTRIASTPAGGRAGPRRPAWRATPFSPSAGARVPASAPGSPCSACGSC